MDRLCSLSRRPAECLEVYQLAYVSFFDPTPCRCFSRTDSSCHVEPKKVLKPDAFQDFELKEKTIISHNVAMSVAVTD